jgi:hypothetical protein
MTSNLPFSKWEAIFKDAMMTEVGATTKKPEAESCGNVHSSDDHSLSGAEQLAKKESGSVGGARPLHRVRRSL